MTLPYYIPEPCMLPDEAPAIVECPCCKQRIVEQSVAWIDCDGCEHCVCQGCASVLRIGLEEQERMLCTDCQCAYARCDRCESMEPDVEYVLYRVDGGEQEAELCGRCRKR